MPPWLLLTLVVAGFSLLAPLFVLAATGGNWRQALTAWRQYCIWLGALALPGGVVWGWLSIFPPVP